MPDVNRKPPDKNHDQSVLFKKDKWNKSESEDWLKRHDYFTDGYDKGQNFHRWRQYNIDSERFNYRTQDRGNDIKVIYASKK